VRALYWFAFRGIRVEKASRIAEELADEYVSDLQDPAASAVLAADEAVVITASPTFMAQPWLERFLRVPRSNIYGAELSVSNGRYTGRCTAPIPLGMEKVNILNGSVASSTDGAVVTGYGDHPTDVPFLQACRRGVLVAQLPYIPEGLEYVAPFPFDYTGLVDKK